MLAEKWASKNCLPIRDLNYKGRLIKNDGSSIEIDLVPSDSSIKKTNIIATLEENGKVSGNVNLQHFDYNALVFRNKYLGISKDSYIENFERNNLGIDIDNYESKNEKLINEPIIETYSFKSNDIVEVIGNKVYISPLLFFTMKQNPFKQENRLYPVDFAFPNKDSYRITINIPENYVVESVPKDVSYVMVDKLVDYLFKVSIEKNKISILMNLDIKNSVITSDYYNALKDFFKVVIDKQNEKIVLKKV